MSTDDVIRTGIPRYPIITLRPTFGQTLRLLTVPDLGHVGLCTALYGAWGYYLARNNPFRRASTVAGLGLGLMFGLAWTSDTSLEVQRNWHLLSGNLNNQHVVGGYEHRLDRPDLLVLPDGVFFERDANKRINELAESKAYMPHAVQHVTQ